MGLSLDIYLSCVPFREDKIKKLYQTVDTGFRSKNKNLFLPFVLENNPSIP
jgi:hypothetical protein